MPHCKMGKCTSHSGRTGDSVHLFRFPTDIEMARKWLVLCRIELKCSIMQYKFSDKDRVCSLHFEKDQYGYDRRTQTLMNLGTLKKKPPPKVKPGAIPTLNMPPGSEPNKGKAHRANTEARLAKQAAEREKQEKKKVSFQ